MTVYFGFTVAGDRSSVQTARRIVQLLEAAGHRVLTRHLVEDDAWEADRRISPQEIYQRDMKWLDACDIFIAEASGSSFGMGFEAGYVLAGGSRRVVLFFRRENASKISLLITGNQHPNCTLFPYADIVELEQYIRAGMPAIFPAATP